MPQPAGTLRREGARLVRLLARSLGYDIRRKGVLGRTMADACAQLRAGGFEPATVFDVGVGRGTPDLYAAFPKASFILVEPLREYDSILDRLAQQLKAIPVRAVAGSSQGTVRISVEGEGSSLLVTERERSREVPMVTLDCLRETHSLRGPFVIKADVQGGELEVLAGAEQVLCETEAVALEVSLFSPRAGWPQFDDVLRSMARRDFVIYDFFGGHRRRDGALAQIDIVFVKAAGRFRESHAYP